MGEYMRILFVFNAHAGKGLVKTNLAAIIDIMSAAGHEVTVYSTQAAGDARQKILSFPEGKYDRVVCAGGDGTLDEVVSGMNERNEKLPIGYIPAGSTNDFAVSLGLPKNMKKAAETAISNNLYNCDTRKFNDSTFVYIAAFGLFTEVSYETPQDAKNFLGHSAYILEGMKRLQDIKSYVLTVEANGKTLEREFIYGMVTNSQSVGGFKNITGKNVDLSDGLFEVTLIEKPANPMELGETINALMNRDVKAKGLKSFKTSKVTFTSKDPIPWTLDGEYGGTVTTAVVENLHHNLFFAVGD